VGVRLGVSVGEEVGVSVMVGVRLGSGVGVMDGEGVTVGVSAVVEDGVTEKEGCGVNVEDGEIDERLAICLAASVVELGATDGCGKLHAARSTALSHTITTERNLSISETLPI